MAESEVVPNAIPFCIALFWANLLVTQRKPSFLHWSVIDSIKTHGWSAFLPWINVHYLSEIISPCCFSPDPNSPHLTGHVADVCFYPLEHYCTRCRLVEASLLAMYFFFYISNYAFFKLFSLERDEKLIYTPPCIWGYKLLCIMIHMYVLWMYLVMHPLNYPL